MERLNELMGSNPDISIPHVTATILRSAAEHVKTMMKQGPLNGFHFHAADVEQAIVIVNQRVNKVVRKEVMRAIESMDDDQLSRLIPLIKGSIISNNTQDSDSRGKGGAR